MIYSKLPKYAGMFLSWLQVLYKIILVIDLFSFINTKLRIFRVPTNQSIPKTPSRCLNFSFSVKVFPT